MKTIRLARPGDVDAPPVPIPLDHLPQETVADVLEKYTKMLNE